MSFAVIITVAIVILLAEIPDKTMISTLLLASRYKTLPVLLGASTAFIAQSALATTIGGLLAHLNHKVISIATSSLFLLGGLWLIFTKERIEEEKGEKLASKEMKKFHSIFLIAFVITFLGEIGDLTEIVTANFAASYKAPLSVFIGASLGLVTFAFLGSLSGMALKEKIPFSLVRKLGGIALVLLSTYSFFQAFKII